MHLLISVLLAGASLSLVQAQNASTILPRCAQLCTLQAFNESSCTATNLTCVCKDPTYAAVFDKCETQNCTAAEQEVTDAYALNVCAPVGGFGHNNTTASSTAARVSGTATPTGNVSLMRNSTMMHNGPFNGTPLPFTGGSGVFRGCGMMVLAGLLVGGMAVAL